MAQKYRNGLVIQETGNVSAFMERPVIKVSGDMQAEMRLPAGIGAVHIVDASGQQGQPIKVATEADLPVASAEYENKIYLVEDGNKYEICKAVGEGYEWKVFQIQEM